MNLWPFQSRERRSQSPENPALSLSDPATWEQILGNWKSAAGVTVTIDKALTVPAIRCAVNFLSGSLAALPVHEFKRTAGGRERITTGMIAGMLGGTVNDDRLTSFAWRKGMMASAMLTGAGRTFIEKDQAGKPMNLWPLETAKTKKIREGGRVKYQYKLAGKVVTYDAAEVIDITPLERLDGLGPVDPIKSMRDTIGLAIAIREYAAAFFANGGVPPLALHGPAASPGAIGRATGELEGKLRTRSTENRNVLYMPAGHELKPIGFDPEKGQLIEAQRYLIEEFSRWSGIPPVFLQDLTHGSFTNTEQQDLHLVKHLIGQWVELWDQELNAKLYGERASSRYVEHNVDGLLRGDFKTRMDGLAVGVQNGLIMPDEGREMLNRPKAAGGDRLFIQGATVPIDKAGQLQQPPAPKGAPPANDPPAKDPAAADPAEPAA